MTRIEMKTYIMNKIPLGYETGAIFTTSQVMVVVDDIYDAMGTCGECIYFRGGMCSTIDTLTQNKIRFCSDFERVEDDKY